MLFITGWNVIKIKHMLTIFASLGGRKKAKKREGKGAILNITLALKRLKHNIQVTKHDTVHDFSNCASIHCVLIIPVRVISSGLTAPLSTSVFWAYIDPEIRLIWNYLEKSKYIERACSTYLRLITLTSIKGGVLCNGFKQFSSWLVTENM